MSLSNSYSVSVEGSRIAGWNTGGARDKVRRLLGRQHQAYFGW